MNRGTFNSIYEVNKAYPTGGVRGDYVTIGGTRYYWWPDAGKWSLEGSEVFVDDSEGGLELLLSKLNDYIDLVNDALDRAASIATGGTGLGGLLTSLNGESAPLSQGYLHWNGNHYTWESDVPGLGDGVLSLNEMSSPESGGYLYNDGGGNGWSWQWVHAGKKLRLNGTTLSLLDEHDSVLNSVTLPSGGGSVTLTGLLGAFNGEGAPNATQDNHCFLGVYNGGFAWRKCAQSIVVDSSADQIFLLDHAGARIGVAAPLSDYAHVTDVEALENHFEEHGSALMAEKFRVSRTLWGRSFDGTGNVTGALSNVTNITMSGDLYMSAGQAIRFSAGAAGTPYVLAYDNDRLEIGSGVILIGKDTDIAGRKVSITTGYSIKAFEINDEGVSTFYHDAVFRDAATFNNGITLKNDNMESGGATTAVLKFISGKLNVVYNGVAREVQLST